MNNWQALAETVEARLAGISSDERGVFAAGVAERHLSWHESLPEDHQAPFTLSLRPLLDSVWAGVLGDGSAFAAVNRGVAEFMLSEYCHNDGQEGPQEAGEPAAEATLQAAHTYLFGCVEFAIEVSRRAVDAADLRDDYFDELRGYDIPYTDATLVAEVRRQLRDLDLIASHADELGGAFRRGLAPEISARLRLELRTPLSSQD